MRPTARDALAGLISLLVMTSAMACSQLPKIGAGGLLHPGRRTTIGRMPAGCEDTAFPGDGVTLRGWRCGSAAPSRGTIVYLHGIADNRTSASGVIERFT